MFKKAEKKPVANPNNLTVSTVIAEELAIIGDLKGHDSIRIDGKVQGNIEVKEGLILGEKCFVEGDIVADSILVFGKIIGNITCRSLEIRALGKISGNIDTAVLAMESGASINGQVHMALREEAAPLLLENK